MNKASAALSRLSESFFSRMAAVKHPILLIVIVGFLIRFVIGLLVTYNYDIYHWGVIIQNIDTGNRLYGLDGYYYTPPWGYILAAISSFGEFLGMGDMGMRITEALMVEQYDGWHFTATIVTLPFVLLMKMPIFLCDLAVAYVIRWIVLERTGNSRKGTIAFALWFLCPLTMVVSGVTAMFDSFTVLMLLLCVVFLMQDRCLPAGAMFCLSVLTKFFPVFLIFVLVAYIMKRHANDGLVVKKMLMAIIGAVLMFAVIMAPQIMDGEIGESFAFLTSRASSGMGTGLGMIEQYGTIIVYALLAAASVFLAYRMHRKPESNIDGTFMFTMMLNLIVLFLYPSTPQYMLLLLPFLIYHMVAMDWPMISPGTVLVIGSVVFAMAANFTTLLSVAAYTDMVSIGSIMDLVALFQSPVFGLSPMSWMYYGGGVAQYAGTLLLLLHVYVKEIRSTGEGADAIRYKHIE